MSQEEIQLLRGLATKYPGQLVYMDYSMKVVRKIEAGRIRTNGIVFQTGPFRPWVEFRISDFRVVMQATKELL